MEQQTGNYSIGKGMAGEEVNAMGVAMELERVVDTCNKLEMLNSTARILIQWTRI